MAEKPSPIMLGSMTIKNNNVFVVFNKKPTL